MTLAFENPWELQAEMEADLEADWPTSAPLLDHDGQGPPLLLILAAWMVVVTASLLDVLKDGFMPAPTWEERVSLLMGHLSLFGVFLSAPIWYPGYRLATWISCIKRGVQQ